MKTKSFALAEVKAAETDDPNGAFEAILSAPTVDRDGEIITGRAFDPLPEHITIDMDHGLSMATTVGSGQPYYDGDVLKIKGTFSSIPRAQEARALVAEGHIRTMSVAFMGAEREKAKDGEPVRVTKGELLNAAFVAVPSNRDALVLSAKALNGIMTPDEVRQTLHIDGRTLAQAVAAGIKNTPKFQPPALKVGARNSGSDAERLQAIHDLAVANGAACETKAVESAEGKTPTITEPELAAATAPATPPADVNVAKARFQLRADLLRHSA